jgi:hypothetical protein
MKLICHSEAVNAGELEYYSQDSSLLISIAQILVLLDCSGITRVYQPNLYTKVSKFGKFNPQFAKIGKIAKLYIYI